MDIQELENRRDQILSEMQAMRSMRRGSITEQYVEDKRKTRRSVRSVETTAKERFEVEIDGQTWQLRRNPVHPDAPLPCQ